MTDIQHYDCRLTESFGVLFTNRTFSEPWGLGRVGAAPVPLLPHVMWGGDGIDGIQRNLLAVDAGGSGGSGQSLRRKEGFRRRRKRNFGNRRKAFDGGEKGGDCCLLCSCEAADVLKNFREFFKILHSNNEEPILAIPLDHQIERYRLVKGHQTGNTHFFLRGHVVIRPRDRA